MKSPSKNSAEYVHDDNIYEVRSIPSDATNAIEYTIMVLSNISILEEGQKHILGEDKL
jgi:hypothetical protein